MNADLVSEIKIPEGIKVTNNNGIILVEGPKGVVEKDFVHPKVDVVVKDGLVVLSSKNATKREKTSIGTFKAHLNNMFVGVTEGHVYKLKICCSHFPMTVTQGNNQLVIKNYLGEAYPRTVKLKDGVTVKIQDKDIIVESLNVELAGQTAADIETATKITNKDRRIFQDGIFIVEKKGKKI
jgi:large subunit ribosomal protein L6